MNVVVVLCYPNDRKVVREWLRQQEIREGFRGVQIATERFHMQGVNIEAFVTDDFGAPAELIDFAKSRMGRTPGLKPDFLTLDELQQRCECAPMLKRDDPEILADLIRLIDLNGGNLTAPQLELLEQARAALYKHVVAAGRADLSLRAREPLFLTLLLWFIALFMFGVATAGAMADSTGWIKSAIAAISAIVILFVTYVARSHLTRSKP